jgi:S-adenosylmethionine hydrolase
VIITFTSDFGARDSYVAQMKGIILQIAPEVRLVDVTHDLSPQDVAAGAFVLSQVTGVFPRGTVHLAVVDPGVGGAREPIVLDCGDFALVGPDNGLLSLAGRDHRGAYRITNPAFQRRDVSPTFHGRDVFAPAAAQLALGAAAHEAGPHMAAIVRLEWPEPAGDAGEVVHIDRFGNLVTNLRDQHVAGARALVCGSLEAPIGRTYADVPSGAPIAYLGSSGLCEIAMREASAAAWTAAQRGTPVQVRR